MEIGDKVKWMTGSVLTTGVYLEEVNEEDSLIFVHTIGGQSILREESVKTKILIKN